MSFIDDVGEFKEVIPELFEFILGLGDNVSEKELQAAKELVESVQKKIAAINANIEDISKAIKKINRVYSIARVLNNNIDDALVTYWDKTFPYSISSEAERQIASIEKQLKEFKSDTVEGILLGRLKMLADEIDDIWSRISVCNSNESLLDKRNIHLEYLKEKLIAIKAYESIASERLVEMLAVVGG